MIKSPRLELTQLAEAGVTPHHAYEKTFRLTHYAHTLTAQHAHSPTPSLQVDVVNGLPLLTAKPVTYLVNLSEKYYVRKKNKWLPKVKAWIDEKNPGDLLIPFSVALEERLLGMDEEERKAEEEKIGAKSACPKITHIGYASLDVSAHLVTTSTIPDRARYTADSLLHLRSRRGTRMDDPAPHEGSAGSWCHPLRFREQVRVW